MSTTSSSILVTGATGLVGSRILLELLLKGEKVRGLRRPDSSDRVLERVFNGKHELLSQVEWVTGDVTEVLSVYDALVGIEEVYHAAGLVSFDPRQKERLMDVNARGTENVVNMALERGVQRLCHVSSVAALGRAEDGQKVNEQTSWKDSKFNSTYAISKYAAEREVWRGMEEGLSAVILNPTIILGPGGWDTGSGLLFRAVWNGLKFYPQGTNGFVDVRDVARVGISLMEQQRFGARFVVSSEDVSYEYLFTEIARALGRKPPRIKASPFMTGLAWRLDKVRSGITGGSPVITKETAMTSSSHWYYDASESVKATGSGYIPVLQSVHDWAETFLKTYR